MDRCRYRIHCCYSCPVPLFLIDEGVRDDTQAKVIHVFKPTKNPSHCLHSKSNSFCRKFGVEARVGLLKEPRSGVIRRDALYQVVAHEVYPRSCGLNIFNTRSGA
jgi:hypothetical protein